MSEGEQKFEILLIEDNAGEAKLLQEILRDCGELAANCHVSWLMNSADVIPYLRSPEMAPYRPNLIIVDYKMPTDGGKALTDVKSDPDFLHIPAVVLTGAISPKEICDIYRRGANCCYHKPSTLDGYHSLVETIVNHWLGKICVPSC